MQKITLTDSIEISKELSIAIGRTLTIKSSRMSAVNTIEKLDTLSDAATLSALMEVDTKITAYEKKRLNDLNTNLSGLFTNSNHFKSQLLYELKQNSKDYPLLLTGLNLKDSNIDIKLTSLVANQNLELYIPYAENFNFSTISKFTMGFDNLSDDDEQSGQQFTDVDEPEICSCDPPASTLIPSINDDYFALNPSFALSPSDGDDYYGGTPQSGLVLAGTYISSGPSALPSPISATYTTLVNNYNIADFGGPEEYVMSTSIPKLRVKGTSWKRNLSSKLRVLIIRAGSKFNINSDGTYGSTESAYYYRVDISAHSLRNNRWINVNWSFDPNWQPQQGSQQIICMTLRKNAGKATATGDVKIKLDAQGHYTPETSVSVSYSKDANTSILRGNRELDAQQVFATIIGGAEPGNPTYQFENTNYSVRKIDRFEYFFKHEYKDLTN